MINKDRKPFYWLNEESRTFLSRGYLKENETGESRIQDMAENAASILGLGQSFVTEFYNYASLGYYSFSTPVWTNFGRKDGLAISCYGSYCDDSLDSILNMGRELGMMSKYGGGTSAYVSAIRPRGTPISTGGLADGPTHYSHIFDTIIDKCKQAEARRGACAIYLDIEHDDILEFLDIGKEGNDIQNLQHGICVGNSFMEKMIAGDQHSRVVWAKLIESRKEVGYPYIFFKDNVNDNSPYKEEIILASNLCSEICLPSNIDESFVCCLGSINLLHWDEIKDTNAIHCYTLFLNAVMQDFINKAKNLPGMGRAVRFAENHRAIGIGVLGYHSYLQEHFIEFESIKAKQFNQEVFKTLKKDSYKASEYCHTELGISNSYIEGRANTTTMAIAPTKSSSFILGQVSLGIEPITSNYFVKDTAKVKSVYKNPTLLRHLESIGKNTPTIWKSILDNNGSVQHLDIPNKEVFKSFVEISPMEIITQAAQRQKFIDQSQSLNLSIHDDISIKDINQLYITAWKEGVKTLYYQIGESEAQNFAREINSCIACES